MVLEIPVVFIVVFVLVFVVVSVTSLFVDRKERDKLVRHGRMGWIRGERENRTRHKYTFCGEFSVISHVKFETFT